jgi:hypothetical protein
MGRQQLKGVSPFLAVVEQFVFYHQDTKDTKTEQFVATAVITGSDLLGALGVLVVPYFFRIGFPLLVAASVLLACQVVRFW